MGGVSCSAEGYVSKMGVVKDLKGGERGNNNLLSCSHCALEEGLAAGTS